jgi:hypothetical protein
VSGSLDQPSSRSCAPLSPSPWYYGTITQIKVPGSISGRDHPHLSRFVSKVVPHTHAVKSRQHSSEVMQPPSPYVPDLNTSTYDRMEAFQRICENSLATHQPPRCSRCSPLPDHATTSLERPRQIRLTAFSSLSPFWP